MVLQKEMSVLTSYNKKWSVSLGVALSNETSKVASTVTHFLQQDHTYSNKAIPSNSATPFGGHFLSNQHTFFTFVVSAFVKHIVPAMRKYCNGYKPYFSHY